MNQYSISPQAREDMHSAWDYIAVKNHNPEAADRLLLRFCDLFLMLANYPYSGQARDDLRSGLRTFSAENYVILFYPEKRGVEIVGVLHGMRDIEGLFERGER
jgi:plasmid stabilization system protein ParE